jgi:putative tricarboxylic transport membrane protein
MLVPRSLLFGSVLVLASVGAYSLNRSLLDVALLFLVGVVSWGMRVLNVPLVPAVLGLILGPLAEQQFRRAIAISQGDPSVFLTRPIAAGLLAVAAVVLIAPALLTRRGPSSSGPAQVSRNRGS